MNEWVTSLPKTLSSVSATRALRPIYLHPCVLSNAMHIRLATTSEDWTKAMILRSRSASHDRAA